MASVAALRAGYIANRDRVRAWTRNWDCPEVELPAVGTMPFPWLRANDPQLRRPGVSVGEARPRGARGRAGWHGEEDLRALYAWLFEGLDSRPMIQAVRGQRRIGFTRFEILRVAQFDGTTEINTRLRLHWTDTTLSGEPLNSDGEPATRTERRWRP